LHTPVGLWVIDLISSKGTFLNGQPVRWARLEDGDQLQVGPFLIRASYDGPAPAAATTLSGPATAVMPWPANPGEPAAAPLVPAVPAGLVPGDHQPLLDQFQVLQQQMLDQFHQTMLMMAQMFTTLHREQMDLVRDELERMHRLTRELQDLRAQLTGQTSAPPTPEAVALLGAPRRAETPGPEKGPRSPAQTPLPATALPGGGAGGGPAATTSDPSIHAWLSRRIAELNAEREGSWQKIRNFLMGK
jgi:hypothetical protein